MTAVLSGMKLISTSEYEISKELNDKTILENTNYVFAAYILHKINARYCTKRFN